MVPARLVLLPNERSNGPQNWGRASGKNRRFMKRCSSITASKICKTCGQRFHINVPASWQTVPRYHLDGPSPVLFFPYSLPWTMAALPSGLFLQSLSLGVQNSRFFFFFFFHKNDVNIDKSDVASMGQALTRTVVWSAVFAVCLPWHFFAKKCRPSGITEIP